MSKIFGFNNFNSDFNDHKSKTNNKYSDNKNSKSKVFGFKDFNNEPGQSQSPNKSKGVFGFKDFKSPLKKPQLSPNIKKKAIESNNRHAEKDEDYLLALQIQLQFQNEDSGGSSDLSSQQFNSPKKHLKFLSPQKPMAIRENLGDPEFDLIDPCPDIRALFQEYDKKYFWNTLGSCIVEWSKRMTICAGIFYLRGGGTIRLSQQLLQYRPRKNLVETLLHEMIHAYLYLTRNFKDRDGHGDEFKSHMNRINALACTNITIYHTFHDEVNACRVHVWRCTGTCRTWKPFYGYVKRSMNRAPSKNDRWWANHQAKCQGKFEKVSEPESYTKKNLKKDDKSILQKSSIIKPKTSILPGSSQQGTQSSKSIDNFFKLNKPGLTSPVKPSNSNNNALIVKTYSPESTGTLFKLGKPAKTSPVKPLNSDNASIKPIKSILPSSSQGTQSSKSIDNYFKLGKPGLTTSPVKKPSNSNNALINQVKTSSSPESRQSMKSTDTLFKLGKPAPSPTKSSKTIDKFKSPSKWNKTNDAKSNSDLMKPKSTSNINENLIKKRKSDDIGKTMADSDDEIQLVESFIKKTKPSSGGFDDVIVLDDDIPLSLRETAECPVCGGKFPKDMINSHVNSHF